MNELQRIEARGIDNLILQSDTLCMKSRSTEQPAENTESQSDWVKTPDADLVRYKPSGIYFAPLRIRGKLFRQSQDRCDQRSQTAPGRFHQGQARRDGG